MLRSESRNLLHQLALNSIEYGFTHSGALPVTETDYSPPLSEPGASFVTLTMHGNLRGCIGSLEPRRALVVDVAENAWAAAFRDPRFPPLAQTEFAQIELEISVLDHPEPIEFTSEEDLLQQLRPGIDGLILTCGPHRGTFLPGVWSSLPDPAMFLRNLKRKAGLAEDYWSDDIRISRYTTEKFGETPV